jgi:ABC-type transporter Mla subunit MlaD
MELKLEQESTQTKLSAALDDTVEAAVALRMTERELVAQVLECLHQKSSKGEPPQAHKMFDPQAGP